MDSTNDPKLASAHPTSEHSTSPQVMDNTQLHCEDTNVAAEADAVITDEVATDEAVSREQSSVPQDEASALKGLTEDVRDQDDLERDITRQAELAMIAEEDDRDKKRIQKVKANIVKLKNQRTTENDKLTELQSNPAGRAKCLEKLEKIKEEIAALRQDIQDIQARIDERHEYEGQNDTADHKQRLPNESHRDFLIRTGKITPFSRMHMADSQTDHDQSELGNALVDAEEASTMKEVVDGAEGEPRSHQNLRMPGFGHVPESTSDVTPDTLLSTTESEFGLRPRKKRVLGNGTTSDSRPRARKTSEDVEDDFVPNVSEEDEDAEEAEADALMTSRTTKKRTRTTKEQVEEDFAGLDDGNEEIYQARLARWVKDRGAARRLEAQNAGDDETPAGDDSNEKEWFRPCPGAPDHVFENGLKLPGDIFPALFDYQKTGVQWLSELYNQSVGGIVGDEMGLGKTIQVISFIAALHYSKKLTKPVIVVAPATVLRQWVNEFHKWWPALRVSILHSSGTGMINVKDEARIDDDETLYGRKIAKPAKSKSERMAKKIVDRVVKHGHVLVTTYAGLQTYNETLVSVDWEYAVLDEGHKIRNPNTSITIHCKELRTPNRVILSGTPIQNNLVELWSLFDFVFPMRLGTLVSFRQNFEIPIKMGGYANASNLQVLTATKCAETLKDAISPYLLQRLKVDVASDLPEKSEQVLFCKLTKQQREAYDTFLASDEMRSIMRGGREALYGIDILRKICNHPDLADKNLAKKEGYKFGSPNKSGKMQVVKALLNMWKGFGHKTLLFTQSVQMLEILEDFVKTLPGFNYFRMDGKTPVKQRQTLVDEFNKDPNIHVFLLSTKVGGLGVNLTGANRVIIYDPDWNPSTDIQARERAWRLGQKKEVTIYRLMTAGAIEEKIYHRQIFKQFLTNKILKDPKQRQTFQMKDLHDLFTLGSTEDGVTETGAMFKGTEVKFDKSPSPSTPGNASTPKSLDADSDAEIRNFAGVDSMASYRGNQDKPDNQEARLMEGIFANSGVHSALEHDQIINGKRKPAADRGMLEHTARQIAAEGAAALRRAAEAAQSIAPGTVTWTGEYGSAGRPATANVRRGAGPSSSSVLSSLADRQGRASSSGSGRGAGRGSAFRPSNGDYSKLIQGYIRRAGPVVSSDSLKTYFDRMCRSARDADNFKESLNRVAVKDPGTGSGRLRGMWRLKPEHR